MIKKALSWIVFISLLTLVVIGMASKNKINQYLSQRMVTNATPQIIKLGTSVIDSLYNYSKNASSYKITFIEFGAKGCSACRKMETVMDEIRTKYPEKVKVVFLNILEPESQDLMKYYGIVSIPTQILLERNGQEFFRHSGYLPTHEFTSHPEFKKLNN